MSLQYDLCYELNFCKKVCGLKNYLDMYELYLILFHSIEQNGGDGKIALILDNSCDNALMMSWNPLWDIRI